jgi:predicted phosphoribosyltransferase
VLAVPVAPPDSIESLRGDSDEIVCLATPAAFLAISVFYGSFPQLADSEVSALMEQAGGVHKAA